MRTCCARFTSLRSVASQRPPNGRACWPTPEPAPARRKNWEDIVLGHLQQQGIPVTALRGRGKTTFTIDETGAAASDPTDPTDPRRPNPSRIGKVFLRGPGPSATLQQPDQINARFSKMPRACPDYQETWRFSRRSLLKAGSAGILGLNLPALLRAASAAGRSARARHIIFLHQFGGPSHLDTFDMKPDAPSGIRGEFKPIATHQGGLTISEHLPRFATVLDRFAQVRSVNHRMRNHNSAT